MFLFSGKVAEHATLLEPRGRRIVTTSTTTASSLTVPHASPTGTVFKANSRRPPRSRIAEPLLTAMPGIRSLLNGRSSRRNLLENSNQQSPLVVKTTTAVKHNGNETVSTPPPLTPPTIIHPAGSVTSLRKCDTVVTLTGLLR